MEEFEFESDSDSKSQLAFRRLIIQRKKYEI